MFGRENCSRNSFDCKIFPSWNYRLAFARLSPVVGWQPRKSSWKLFSSFHVRYLGGVLWHLKHSVPSRHSKKIERKKNKSAQVFVLLPVFPTCLLPFFLHLILLVGGHPVVGASKLARRVIKARGRVITPRLKGTGMEENFSFEIKVITRSWIRMYKF